MEIKGVNIKSMKYDAFNDNEYIEELRANGVNVVVGKLDQLIKGFPHGFVPGKLPNHHEPDFFILLLVFLHRLPP